MDPPAHIEWCWCAGMFQVASAVRGIRRYTASSNLTGFCERFRSPLATVCLRQYQQLPLQLRHVIYSIFSSNHFFLGVGPTLCQFLFPFSSIFSKCSSLAFLSQVRPCLDLLSIFFFLFLLKLHFLNLWSEFVFFKNCVMCYFVSFYVFFNFSEPCLLLLSLFSLFHLLVVNKPSRLWIHFLGLLRAFLHLLYHNTYCHVFFSYQSENIHFSWCSP